jgi:hypothetical protein
MNSEDDRNEKEKEYDEYLLNWENLRKEFEQNKIEEEKRKNILSNEKNKKKEKGQPQKMQNNLLYNFLNNSKYHTGNITLLSEKQEFDENEKYQKLVDLLYEENETVPDIQLIDKKQDDYFITQLYTTFSLLSRNVYLDLPGNEKKNEKLRSFLQSLNNVNYDNNKVLNNQTFHMINHNILRPEKYYQNLTLQNNCNENETEKMIKKQNELRIQREKELKKQLQIQREKEKLSAIKLFRGDNLTIEPKYKNIKEQNEFILRDKLSKISKIIDINDKYLSEMTKKEFDKIFNDIYYGKEIDFDNTKNFSLSYVNDEDKLKEDYEFWDNNCKSYREKYGFFNNDNILNQSFRRNSFNK